MELVVGLEVHVELATKTKLFCGCENKFSHIPNTLTCPTCVGLPGSLPVMNEKAVEFAMRLGRALGCDIHPSVMARKNYFYPDMAKDFQTTQYDQPTNADGRLALADGTVVGIERPTSKRTPARPPTSVAVVESTTPPTPWSTTTAPVCRSSRS